MTAGKFIYIARTNELPAHLIIDVSEGDQPTADNNASLSTLHGFDDLRVLYSARFQGEAYSKELHPELYADLEPEIINSMRPTYVRGFLDEAIGTFRTKLGRNIYKMSLGEALRRIACQLSDSAYCGSQEIRDAITVEDAKLRAEWAAKKKKETELRAFVQERVSAINRIWQDWFPKAEKEICSYMEKNPLPRVPNFPDAANLFQRALNAGSRARYHEKRIERDNAQKRFDSFVRDVRIRAATLPTTLDAPCGAQYCGTNVTYSFRFYEPLTDYDNHGVLKSPMTTSHLLLLVGDCPTCKERAEIPVSADVQIFTDDNSSRWLAIWRDRYWKILNVGVP
jgi:hypothetical protein